MWTSTKKGVFDSKEVFYHIVCAENPVVFLLFVFFLIELSLLNHTLAHVSRVHEGSLSPKICILGINATHISTCCCGLNKAAGLVLQTPGALKLSNHYLLLAWKAIFDHLNPKRLAETLKIDQTFHFVQTRHSEWDYSRNFNYLQNVFCRVDSRLSFDRRHKARELSQWPSQICRTMGHIHNYHCCSQNDLTIVFCLRYSEQ